jgi:uncharacterized radical SAM superfamily Fe-S cluster-containing enzyme
LYNSFISKYNNNNIQLIDKRVSSLCPICLKVIPACIFQEGRAVMIEKHCEEHGDFKDIYWSDADIYRRFIRYQSDCISPNDSPRIGENCPSNCGLCKNHKTGTLLANIDVTNRCNLSCPICFADAGGESNEPTIGQIGAMMQALRDQMPVPCPAVQFSGGEPTLRRDLQDIIFLARNMGFAQIQIASNGILLAARKDLCRMLAQCGLNTIYLQFDGVTPQPYKTIRGCDIFTAKLQAIENLRETGQLNLVLVPTLVKGVNDDQIGDIVKFATKNADVVRGINYQPVSFAGRINREERIARRITIPDVLRLLEDQTDNEITRNDFYPIPFVEPISHLIAAMSGTSKPVLTSHPCCGAGTYVFCHGDRNIPITRFLDVEGLMESIRENADNFDGSLIGKLKMEGTIFKQLSGFIDASKTPDDLNLKELIMNVFIKGTRESLAKFHNGFLFLGIMHFQDLYNIDLEKLERCGIHYSLPDGRIIPFCSYNTVHRSKLH